MIIALEPTARFGLTAAGLAAFAGFSALVVMEQMAPPAAESGPRINAVRAAVPAQNTGADDQQAFYPLFGHVAAPGAPVEELSDSSIALKGTFSDGKAGFALITVDGKLAVYGLGDRVERAGHIEAIESRSVTLAGDDGRFALRFPDTQLGGVGGRADIKAAALTAMRFTRVRLADGAIGLRLNYVDDDPASRALGLERGDVITAINGQPVRHPKAIAAIAQTASGQVDIDYLRAGQSRTLRLSFTAD